MTLTVTGTRADDHDGEGTGQRHLWGILDGAPTLLQT